MTANNKIDLLVKSDGSVEPLLPDTVKTKSDKRGRLCVAIAGMLVFLALMAAIVVIIFVVVPSRAQKSYSVKYGYDQVRRCGTVDFMQIDAIEKFQSDDGVVTIRDGFKGVTAVKINTGTKESPSFICMIRDDEKYDMAGPPILPRPEMLDHLMEQTTAEGPMDVVMDAEEWVPDEYEAVDFDKLPAAIASLCDGIVSYRMRPRSEEVLDDEDDEEDEVYSDEEEDSYDNEENSITTNEESSLDFGRISDVSSISEDYENDGDEEETFESLEYDDEEEEKEDDKNYAFYDGPVLSNLDIDDGKQEMKFDDLLNLNAIFDDNTEADKEYKTDYSTEPSIDAPLVDYYKEDAIYPLPTPFVSEFPLEDDKVPDFTDDIFHEIEFRKKRQAVNETEEEEDDDEEGQRNVNVPSLNLGERETDANLGCCNHCRRAYVQCEHVCVPIQQNTYPYFYRSCKYVQCSVILPCAWWRARAAGYV